MWKEQPAGKMAGDRGTHGSPMAENQGDKFPHVFLSNIFCSPHGPFRWAQGKPARKTTSNLNTAYTEEHVRGACEEYV